MPCTGVKGFYLWLGRRREQKPSCGSNFRIAAAGAFPRLTERHSCITSTTTCYSAPSRPHPRASLSMMAAAYSFVDALPPRSPVMDLPSAMVLRWAISQRSTCLTGSTYIQGGPLNLGCVLVQVHVPTPTSDQSGNPRSNRTYLSIIREDNNRAVGLANPLPTETARSEIAIPKIA